MAAAPTFAAIQCELRVIGAKNIEIKHIGSLFVRCYLSAGNNKRVQLDTREITMPSERDENMIFWNENFSLECYNTDGSNISSKLREESMVFELRWRPNNSKPKFMEKVIGGSQLLASSEVAWKVVLDAPSMEVQTWVTLSNPDELLEGAMAKPRALQIAIKARVLESMISMEDLRRRSSRGSTWSGCSEDGGDCWCSSCVDNELLFVAEALEGCF